MYDMYPWDKPADPGQARRLQSQKDSPATAAVQVALDRRDNGGDHGGDTVTWPQPTARQPRQ
jgi:hypothetical protein